jgi:orotate phosphoribosyltransferase
MNLDQRELLDIIRDHSLQIGEFVLSSGKKSSYYLDCRVTTLHPRGALLTARLLLGEIRRLRIEADAIGGLTLGADPIVASVAVVSAIELRPLPAFIVRKDLKKHGTRRRIEGWQGQSGSKVVIVDDVCTSGGSLMEAAGAAESEGYEVSAVMCLVDRLEEASGSLKGRYPFHSLFTIRDLLPEGSGRSG